MKNTTNPTNIQTNLTKNILHISYTHLGQSWEMEVNMEEFIQKSIDSGKINHYPTLPTPPLPNNSSITEYEEEIEERLTPEEMEWYYERDMERIMGEREDGLSDMERANL